VAHREALGGLGVFFFHLCDNACGKLFFHRLDEPLSFHHIQHPWVGEE
jgi:hypothetical protein